jgi:hypothetical protein
MNSIHRLLAVLAAFILAVCATLTAAGATAASTRTTLVIRVVGCPTCEVNLARAFSGTDIYWRSRAKLVGSDHKVVFYPRTSKTRGLSFEIHAPWESSATNEIRNVVTRYAGQHTGHRRSERRAKRSRHAYGCWAGTKRTSVTLHFRVAKFTFDGSDFGQSTHETGAVAWASPGMRSLRPRVDAWHGSIGNQEIFYCS